MCLVIRMVLEVGKGANLRLDHHSFGLWFSCRHACAGRYSVSRTLSSYSGTPIGKSRPWPVYMYICTCMSQPIGLRVYRSLPPSMASKRPRSDSPEASFSRPRRKVTEPDPPPPVPYEDSIFPAQADVSESTRAANLTAMLDRIDRYTTSAERPHDEILQASLRNFLEMLPPDGCAELLKDIDSKPGDEGLYEVFSNLYTGLRCRSKL